MKRLVRTATSLVMLIIVGHGAGVPAPASEAEIAPVSVTDVADASPLLAPAQTRPSAEFLGSLGIVRPVPLAGARCCKVCRKGKACGDTCIARNKVCHLPPGCACDG